MDKSSIGFFSNSVQNGSIQYHFCVLKVKENTHALICSVLVTAEPWLASMSPVEQEVGVDMLMQRMKSLSERAEEFSQEEKTKRFEHIENQSVELSPGLEPLTQLKADIGHFVDDPTFLYQDFARRGEVSDIPTFRVQVSSRLHRLSPF
jgi:hypothetical protein